MKGPRAASIAKYSPRREPTQRRSRVVVQRIRDSALEILVREGGVSLTTNRIAEVAGLSVGSIYQYFPNKDAILAALANDLLDNIQQDVLRLIAASPESEGPQDRARRVLHQFIRGLHAQADQIRALWPSLQALQDHSFVRRPEDVVIETVRQLDRRQNVSLRHRNATAAITIVVDCLSGLINAYLIEGKPDLPAEEFSDLVADLAVRFLYEDER